MHELAITESILDLVLEQASKAGARRVTSIRLRIGSLTDIVPDSVQFYLDSIARGSLAEGARIDPILVATSATCSRCGKAFPAEQGLECPDCGNYGTLTGGLELSVESIEVDE